MISFFKASRTRVPVNLSRDKVSRFEAALFELIRDPKFDDPLLASVICEKSKDLLKHYQIDNQWPASDFNARLMYSSNSKYILSTEITSCLVHNNRFDDAIYLLKETPFTHSKLVEHDDFVLYLLSKDLQL